MASSRTTEGGFFVHTYNHAAKADQFWGGWAVYQDGEGKEHQSSVAVLYGAGLYETASAHVAKEEGEGGGRIHAAGREGNGAGDGEEKADGG